MKNENVKNAQKRENTLKHMKIETLNIFDFFFFGVWKFDFWSPQWR